MDPNFQLCLSTFCWPSAGHFLTAMSDLNEKYLHTPATVCISLDDESTVISPSKTNLVADLVVMIESNVDSQITRCDHKYPEGGWRANLTVLGAFIALFFSFGQMNAFGTFQAWYAGHQLQHLPASTISWIGSLQLWAFFFSGALIGRLFDAHGPKGLMIAGTICYIGSMMLTSVCREYYQYILCQGVLFGLGVGLLFYPSLASISTHFSKYRATAIGIAIAGSSLGGVVYPVVIESLFDHIGFGWGVRTVGLSSGLGCAIATLMISSLSTHNMPGPYFDIQTIKDTRFALLAAGSWFVALGLFIPFFYIVDYARHISVPDHTSFSVLAVLNAGGVLGRIAPAYLSDTIGRFNLLTPAAFLSGLTCVTIWLMARGLTALMLFAATYGFFSGAFIALITPCVAQISDFERFGVRIGMLYSIISFPSLFGGPVAGVLLARDHGRYLAMIIFSGSTVMLGSLFILGARLLVDRRILARV